THAAKMFCARIAGGLDGAKRGVVIARGAAGGSLIKTAPIDSLYPSREVTPSDLTFRLWLGNKWVPAKPVPEEELFVCRTPVGVCACNILDYSSQQESLKREGKTPEPRYRMLLSDPLIRRSAAGWGRAEPVGLALDARISVCQAAGRKFACLSSEREHYAEELKHLDKELELEARLFGRAAAANDPSAIQGVDVSAGPAPGHEKSQAGVRQK
ncbi:MAG TPA: hypothetical protein PLP17_12625, partial [Oligoflexia bacterium]|nr:hypothetical protein [Oligoflexia bacterium]